MIEKANPSHPDKVADRIAGALVDLAYKKQRRPKIAVENLLGHGKCHLIIESSVRFTEPEIAKIVARIAGQGITAEAEIVPQDAHLAENQASALRCGDNGIFLGRPIATDSEVAKLSHLTRALYRRFPTDGKFILDEKAGRVIACQSQADEAILKAEIASHLDCTGLEIVVNPLGYWTGGTDVDTGAVNRKLGSDLGLAVTGGGLHGKDLSKADTSVTIVCYLLAQEHRCAVSASCAIGDTDLIFHIGRRRERLTFAEVVKKAQKFVEKLGGFEKLAEWGLV